MDILVNNKIVNFSQEDFPMLISGKALVGSGSSFFSICLMSQLSKKGEKIVFFTAFTQAKDEFRKQLGDKINKDSIIIESGDENIFLKEIDKINDFRDRIVLVKNIEEYNKKLFNKLKDKELIIFSGDIDKCQFRDELIKKDFKTKIFFSYPEKIKIDNEIELPKYKGLIISPKYNGLISVDI
jgi:hypothetical protein